MKKQLFTTLFFVLITILVSAQETEKKETKEETKEEEQIKGTHRLSFFVGHSHLSEGVQDNGKKGWKAIPSLGLDYDYWVSNKWAIGLHNDMMIETFEVEEKDNTVIERSRPIASVATVIFKPTEHFSFVAGMGGEFAKEENFALTRIGIDAGWPIKDNWEFGIGLVYDIKWNAYDTWVFGFGISKMLGKHRK